MSEFAGRSVVITGAGRGIGRGIADAFAQAGANIMIGARTLSYAEEARDAMRARGARAEVCQLDVKERAGCERLIAETVKAFGGVDIVIHCAADIPYGGVGAVADDALEAAIASTAKAAWWLLAAARPHLAKAKGGGRFIAIGSINGTVSVVPNMTAYGMSKAALDAFVRGAALDVAADGITVNAILPGLVRSARSKEWLGDAGLDAMGANIPVGRAGTPEDVAYGCMFLASPRADYITGTSIRMDGGSALGGGSGRRDGATLEQHVDESVKS